jgi:hypothetical protein
VTWRRSLAVCSLLALCGCAGSPTTDRAGVEPWKPARISSPQFESHAAFDPRTGDLYFVRSSPKFSGWHIVFSHCTSAGWSEPRPAPFAGRGLEADPYFMPDGTLYFISTRAVSDGRSKDLDIYRVGRDAAGAWKTPERLDEPVNGPGAEWFPRPGPGGWLYFGSDRPGGKGGNDIWRAHQDAAGAWMVENLGPAINTPGDEYEASVSPDGTRMVLMADGDLHESRMTSSGWSARTKLGPDINRPGLKVGVLFSPGGTSMLFARDTMGPASGEFFVRRASGSEHWPRDCP